jgi:hypothetical protein
MSGIIGRVGAGLVVGGAIMVLLNVGPLIFLHKMNEGAVLTTFLGALMIAQGVVNIAVAKELLRLSKERK